MSKINQRMTKAILCLIVAASAESALADEADGLPVAFAEGKGRVTVVIDGLPVAVYSFQDETIPRPYFAHVRARNGRQVSRPHPPIEGQDLTDHGTFHPGIWLAFGDMNGSDNWRLLSRVRHADFIEAPRGGHGEGTFVVRNEYLDSSEPSKVICQEIARFTFRPHPEGYLLLWDSTFSADQVFAFGDQEEMGLGIRVATPIRVEQGGRGNLPPGNGTIIDSEGRKNGAQVAGNSADWCDYSGTLAGQRVGMTILCHPENFRPSWFHARDYGLLVANPFGRQAFGKGEKSSVVVRPGEKLRLRYGILVHSGPEGSRPDLAKAYQDYVRLAGE
jgi:hypothetical protein